MFFRDLNEKISKRENEINDNIDRGKDESDDICALFKIGVLD